MEKKQSNYTPRLQNFDLNALLATNYNETPELKALTHRISLAPMLEVTDVNFRFFMRLLTKHMTLYTEMIHENAILNNKNPKLLHFNPIEHPVVLQIGGNNPQSLVTCAKKCEDLGYDEVNINIGCPSERVQHGAFGACLMKEPELVAEGVAAMMKAVKIPVTIKTRLGVDDLDSYEFVHEFVTKTSEKGGVTHFIMHARKAYLKGLNPTENRNVPPLQYDKVLRLKTDFPHLNFSINGGFKTYKSIQDVLHPDNKLVGCMIGRICYDNPWVLSDIDRVFYNKKNLGHSRREILEIYAVYAQHEMDIGREKAHFVLLRPLMNLFNGEVGNSKYRQFFGDHRNFRLYQNLKEYIYAAIELLESLNPQALDARPPLDDPNQIDIKAEVKNTLEEKKEEEGLVEGKSENEVK